MVNWPEFTGALRDRNETNTKGTSGVITIDYFSDTLCVWAYAGQIRLKALQREFGEQVLVRHRFMSLFADTATRIGEGWADKGGFAGFGRHMHEVCAQWEHTRLHPAVWETCRPSSCTTSHVFLRAVGLCLGLDAGDEAGDREMRAAYDALVERVRCAFFEDAQDISRLEVLLVLLAGFDIPAQAVRERIDNGEAYAALQRDAEMMKVHGVLGSPTLLFNEGRQLLYGNVGYRIIESNVRELLSAGHVPGEPSWC
jgi:predicted DsbA family dithiol-disulfide isomerase